MSTAHPIAAIRAEQEAAKDHWSGIVREGILDALRSSPEHEFHADDLAPLGIPDEAGVARVGGGNVVGHISNPTASGHSPDPGDTPKEVDSGSRGFTSPLPAGVDQGEGRVGGRGEPGPENRSAAMPLGRSSAAVKAPDSASPDQLFEVPPEPPRSAWTDAEAA